MDFTYFYDIRYFPLYWFFKKNNLKKYTEKIYLRVYHIIFFKKKYEIKKP
jgi:hypothetical protein